MARACTRRASTARSTTCRSRPPGGSTRRSSGVEHAKAILLVGSNPRWEAPLVNTRIRKAVKQGAKVFAIGPQVDLTYPVEWLGEDIAALGDLPETLTGADGRGRHRGHGRVHDRGRLRRRAADRRGAGRGLRPAPHRCRPRRRARARLRHRRRSWRPSRRRRPSCCSARRRRDRSLAVRRRVQGLYRHAWRRRCARRGRHPAGLGLYREAGHLGQSRGPRPACRARGVPGRRCARGLDDPARALRGAGQDAAVRQPRRAAREDRRGAIRRWRTKASCSRARSTSLPRGGDVSGAIVYPISDFYLTNPIARSSPTMQRCSAELLHGESFAEAAE